VADLRRRRRRRRRKSKSKSKSKKCCSPGFLISVAL